MPLQILKVPWRIAPCLSAIEVSIICTFSRLDFVSEQNGPPINRYFSFYTSYRCTADREAAEGWKIAHQSVGVIRVWSFDAFSWWEPFWKQRFPAKNFRAQSSTPQAGSPHVIASWAHLGRPSQPVSCNQAIIRVTWDQTANCQYASQCKQHSCRSLGSRLSLLESN